MKKSTALYISVLSLLLSSCGGDKVDPTIKLNKNTLTLEVGETEKLNVSITPSDLKDLHLVWEVNSSIATIDDGVVTALAQGVSDIKVFLDLNSNAFYDEGEPFDVCNLTVAEPPVQSIAVSSVTLNESSLSLQINEEKTLSATVLPANSTEKNITWLSSSADVVSVNNGKIVGLKAGNATIIAYVDENGNGQKDGSEKFATTFVTVISDTPETTVYVSSVKINTNSLSLEKDSFDMVYATVLPNNATYKTVTWLTSDSLVATVSGGRVTGIKVGNATVTAYVDENGNATLDNDEQCDTVKITVKAKTVDPTPSDDPIPARGENLPIGNTSVSGPKNTTPHDITNWVDYDFSSSMPSYWTFIMGNNKVANGDFYAESSGGGFKFSHVNYGIQSPLLNSWLKTEVRLTVSQVKSNSQSVNQHRDKPIFHIYSYDINGKYLGVQTYDQQSSFANTKEIKFYIANPDMAYFEIRLYAFPYKGQQCYNFGVSKISIKGWPYPL